MPDPFSGQVPDFVRARLPEAGLFAGQQWRTSPAPFPLGPEVASELESLGRVLLQFYRAANLLYRLSTQGKEAPWVAQWLEAGKPPEIVALQRHPSFKNELPRVIRPDLLLTDDGLALSELDSVPGGIGLTAWLNQTYSEARTALPHSAFPEPIGGPRGMIEGFASIFDSARKVHIVTSEESAAYRPEMAWISSQSGMERFAVRDVHFHDFQSGDGVYRFFELFDLPNVPNHKSIFDLAAQKQIAVTAPPKSFLEEKLLMALLWNRNLHGFWRRELGESFLHKLKTVTPQTWVVDPTPLPPHGAIPGLDLTDWNQLKTFSQKERDLILKVSGFSDKAWGARGVFLGSDLSLADWSAAVDSALRSFSTSPFILQRYQKPKIVPAQWRDFAQNKTFDFPGRVRLCPYYFVAGAGDAARAHLGGVLATVCPAEKKIIHGMTEAVLAPCSV